MGINFKVPVYEVQSFEDVKTIGRAAEIRSLVKQSGYCLVRGGVKKRDVEGAMREVFLTGKMLGEFNRSPKVQVGLENFVRFDKGNFSAGARLCKNYFFFPWNSYPKVLGEIFNKVSILRNILAGKAEGFLLDEKINPGGYYNATRVIYYPPGGGFMEGHTDGHMGKNEADSYDYYVVALPLSIHGIHYSSGGGWVKPFGSNAKVYWEIYAQEGDFIVYDGLCEHGVDVVGTEDTCRKLGGDIIPSGRFLAISSPYKMDSISG